MSDSALADLDARTLAGCFARRELSPRAVAVAVLDRVAEREPDLNAIFRSNRDLALQAASEAGPLPREQLAVRLDRIVRQVDKATSLLSHLKVFGRQASDQPFAPFDVARTIDAGARCAAREPTLPSCTPTTLAASGGRAA